MARLSRGGWIELLLVLQLEGNKAMAIMVVGIDLDENWCSVKAPRGGRLLYPRQMAHYRLGLFLIQERKQ